MKRPATEGSDRQYRCHRVRHDMDVCRTEIMIAAMLGVDDRDA